MTHKGSVNQVILVGHLGADPDVRQTSTGRSVVNLRLATSTRSYTGRDEHDRSTFEARPEWHRIVVFGPLADGIAPVFKKGMHVYISGRLQTRQYTTEDGTEKYVTDIVAEDAFVLGLKNGNGSNHVEAAPTASPQEAARASNNNAQPKAPARKKVAPKAPAPSQEEAEPELEPATTDNDLPF